jgi:hypothetical protein
VSVRNIFLCAALILGIATGKETAYGAVKPIMVHYMPWYVSQPFSGTWGWHWTMKAFDPNAANTNGTQQIASWYYPLIGPYDSADPAVLEYHVLLMKLAGIDGVIVDWYGTDNFNDYAINNQRTLELLNYTRKAGLKFSLCYEDQTIQQEINGNYLTAGAALAHAQQTLLYAQTNYFNDPSFLRISNGPVLLDFGPQYFKDSADWVKIFSVLNPTNSPAFFTEDNRLAAGAGAFDWPPMWLSGGGTNRLTAAQLQGYLVHFEQAARGWPQFISSAFPRFHDIYSEGGASPSYGYLEDASGGTLVKTLSLALTNNCALVHVVTWNDFGEGTVVEPTVDYGYRDLGIIQDLRRQYLEPSFSYHTNDLATAWQFYKLRKQCGADPAVAAKLDRIFASIVSGNVSAASLQLAQIQSNRLVSYQLDGRPSEVGKTAAWREVPAFAAGTNLSAFRTDATQALYQAVKLQ